MVMQYCNLCPNNLLVDMKNCGNGSKRKHHRRISISYGPFINQLKPSNKRKPI